MAKVVAEPCIYWHGDDNLLSEYVMKAAACGASFFKLQLFHPNRTGPAEKWRRKKAFFENNFIDDGLLNRMQVLIGKYGMELICTVNDTIAVARAHKATDNIKIASGQICAPLLGMIRQYKWNRIFVSTGMISGNNGEWESIKSLKECAREVIVMHCRSLYPTSYHEVGLSRIKALGMIFSSEDPRNFSLGYSDHCIDNVACIMSLGMGVGYIEKHFKISGAFGPTIECAADEEEFAELCAIAKEQDSILGEGMSLDMHPREKQSIEHYQGRFII